MKNQFHTSKTYLTFRFNAKLRHIATFVRYSYELETDPPDFDYGNETKNAAELDRFKSGELLNVRLMVRVSALGETGTDYLGQCFVSAKTVDAELIQYAIEHDMKNNACLELKNNIILKYIALKAALDG